MVGIYIQANNQTAATSFKIRSFNNVVKYESITTPPDETKAAHLKKKEIN